MNRMNRTERRADRARRRNAKWRREHPDEIPEGTKSPAGRKAGSRIPVWRAKDKEAQAIQYALTVAFGMGEYEAAYAAALIASRKPIAARTVEAFGEVALKLSAATDQNTLLTSFAGRLVSANLKIVERARAAWFAELDWLNSSTFCVSKLFDSYVRDDREDAAQWLLALDTLGWRVFMQHLAARWIAALRSNLAPEGSAQTRRALEFLEWMAAETKRKQGLEADNLNLTAPIREILSVRCS